MKSLTILIVFLISLIAIAQASTVPEFEGRGEEKIGPNLYLLGVRFKDLYASLATQLIATNAVYDSIIVTLHNATVDAAAKDKQKPPKFFDVWNDNYLKLVVESKKASVDLLNKAKGFKKKLNDARK